jgi:acetyl-CoA acetyltransferase
LPSPPALRGTRGARDRVAQAVPKLLARHGLTVDDIDLWELNEVRSSGVTWQVRMGRRHHHE